MSLLARTQPHRLTHALRNNHLELGGNRDGIHTVWRLFDRSAIVKSPGCSVPSPHHLGTAKKANYMLPHEFGRTRTYHGDMA